MSYIPLTQALEMLPKSYLRNLFKESMDDMLYALILDKERDTYGNYLNYTGHVIAVCDSNEKVQDIIRKVKKNPYFDGSLRVVCYELNRDHSGYSNYPPEEGIKNSREKEEKTPEYLTEYLRD
jgi:hypothetical protein